MITSENINEALKNRDEWVSDRVREAIFKGELKPGERINEQNLSKILQVSRTPVRAALRILAAEGMVTIIPHRGTVVNELSIDEFEEIYKIRVDIEANLAFLAAPNMKDERIEMLRDLVAAMKESDDVDTWLKLNARFHHEIYNAANRPRMLLITKNIRNLATPIIRTYLGNKNYMDSANQQHQLILEACEKRDARLAQSQVEKHLITVLQSVLHSANTAGQELSS
jgi:DNA-binding GntR family transcriptional regulator